MSKWFRVIDPLNPLFGCDVAGVQDDDSLPGYLQVTALRRVDIFVGDRPFQLVAKDGEGLGVMVDVDHLSDSLLQEDIVELDTDRPFGRCIDESEMTRRDGYTLRVARYERAIHVALADPQEELLATRTFLGPKETEGTGYTPDESIIAMFECGNDPDDILTILKRRD